MKYVIVDLYNEAVRALDDIKRSKLHLSERVALEKALAKLDAMKKIIAHSTLSFN